MYTPTPGTHSPLPTTSNKELPAEIRIISFGPYAHRKLAIAAIIVNLQFGIPAFIFSILTQIDYENGNMKGAQRKGALTYKLSIAAICMTLFFVVHFILLHVFVFPYTLYPKLFNS